MTLFGIVLGAPGWIAVGLVLGWLILPQPRFVTWIAEKLGIKDRVP